MNPTQRATSRPRVAIRRRPFQTAARHRRAHSLVELLVVITLLSFLFGASGLFFHLLFRGEHQQRRRADHAAQLNRLAARFRTDVHAAETAEVADDGASAALMLPGDDEIRYRIEPAGVVREKLTAGAVAHRDLFRLMSTESARLETVDDHDQPRVRLTVPLRVDPKFAVHTGDVRIEAVVASENRFTAAGDRQP